MPRSDRELMVALRKGDQEAFRALHDRYARAILNWFNKQCYDRALAEDLTQETFLRIFLARKRYRPEATFRTFLYTVARNLWIDRYRSRKSAPPMISGDTRVGEDGARIVDLLPADGRDVVNKIADHEAVEIVRLALTKLPEAQREVFILVQEQKLKYREVAEILDVPVGTVKSRMNAALTTLRGLLGRELE
jgi:RNA polymerase sigma-70 factor (ECF subfamily)